MSSTLVDVRFRAFSDRTRLRILHLLLKGDLCVGDIVKVLEAPQPTVSRHLAYLRRAGLVLSQKDGLWRHYRLAPAKSAFHQNLMRCLRSCFRNVPKIDGDDRRLQKILKAGGCCPR